MKTQFDHNVRVVSLENLKAMCERVGGTCHKFTVVKETANRVFVQYSNPDEYGNPRPIIAVYPSWPTGILDGSPAVALNMINCTGDRDGYGYQAFFQLEDCPELFRHDNNWLTAYQILIPKHPEFEVKSTWDKNGCVQTWHCKDQDFKSFTEAQNWAVTQMRSIK